MSLNRRAKWLNQAKLCVLKELMAMIIDVMCRNDSIARCVVNL